MTLSGKISSLSPIGLFVKDSTKLWTFLKVCFLVSVHFLIVYQVTTSEITVYTLKRDLEIQRDYVFRVQNVCDDIPRVGHLPASFIPTPGNLPPKTKSKGSVSQLMDDLDLINSVEQVEAMVNSIQKGIENVLQK